MGEPGRTALDRRLSPRQHRVVALATVGYRGDLVLRRIALVAVMGLLVVGCGGPTVSSPASTLAVGSASPAGAAGSTPGSSGSAAASSSEPGSAWTGTSTAVQAALVAAGYVCTERSDIEGFKLAACLKAGVAGIDLYSRADASVAGLDASGTGTALTADEMLSAMGPALDAATNGWSDIAAAVRAAGSPQKLTTSVLPGSGLTLVVRGYAGSSGLMTVSLLAPDLAALWGHVPAVSPAAS